MSWLGSNILRYVRRRRLGRAAHQWALRAYLCVGQ
jgi:hypothetical protein